MHRQGKYIRDGHQICLNSDVYLKVRLQGSYRTVSRMTFNSLRFKSMVSVNVYFVEFIGSFSNMLKTLGSFKLCIFTDSASELSYKLSLLNFHQLSCKVSFLNSRQHSYKLWPLNSHTNFHTNSRFSTLINSHTNYHAKSLFSTLDNTHTNSRFSILININSCANPCLIMGGHFS